MGKSREEFPYQREIIGGTTREFNFAVGQSIEPVTYLARNKAEGNISHAGALLLDWYNVRTGQRGSGKGIDERTATYIEPGVQALYGLYAARVGIIQSFGYTGNNALLHPLASTAPASAVDQAVADVNAMTRGGRLL